MAGTIGYDVSGAGYSITSATTQRATTGAAFTYTAVANDVVSEIGLHAATYTGDGSGWEIGVYDLTANGGISGAPLVATGTITALTANSRNTLAITPVALTAGSEYCVAIRTGSATTISIQGDYVGGGTTQSTFDGTSPLQATFTSGALIGQRWSFFATVTAAAASTASRNVTNVAAGAVQTFQVMAAGVNTTVGEGLGGSDLVVIEDNHQVTVPSAVSGVTLTIDPDTLDYTVTKSQLPAGSSITFDAFYYSPSTEKSSKIAVTITAPQIPTGSGKPILKPVMSPILSTLLN